jgi:hypothetical protein
MEIQVKTLNADGSLVFEGKLNQEQVQFILGVGINFLLANGAEVLQDDDDEDEFVINAPTTETVQ